MCSAGTVEWFYIRLGRTEEARQVILEFFKKTMSTMLACFVGFLVFSVVLLVMVAMGLTALPRWACLLNLLVLFAVMAPFRIVGTLNIAGALMLAGLCILL